MNTIEKNFLAYLRKHPDDNASWQNFADMLVLLCPS